MSAGPSRLSSRKEFLRGLLAGGLSAALPAAAWSGETALADTGVEETTPVEDLMREHGALDRVLLIYDEALRRVSDGREFDPAIVGRAAGIVSRFVEGYHEKLEEQYLFPRMRADGCLVGLVDVLQSQHEAGRRTTAAIAALAKKGDASALCKPLAAFTRMYRPHAAREDTELFPAFKKIVGEKEYRELGQLFEDRERRRFGKAGFEHVLAQIAELEEALGVSDLAQFTPRPEAP